MPGIDLHRRALAAASALLAAVLLTGALGGCSLIGASGQGDSGGKNVVLVTHDSFVLPKKVIAAFEQQSGYHLVVHASGDAGTLTNKLVLTQGDPTGDVAFGVDNTFATRALDADVFAPYDATLPPGASRYALPGSDHRLTPVDTGDVCVVVDKTWYAAHHLAPPRSLADLTDPAYHGQLVLPGATTSSPGMAFLLATIAQYGDGWPAYWTKLLDNGAKVTSDWTQAFDTSFTQGGHHGTYPVVVSYDSDPAFTIPKGGGASTTTALLDTCFRQVEYAGVLTGAANPKGAQAFVDFLLSPTVQKALPDSMYVFPVRRGTPLPPTWSKYAVQPQHPSTVSPADITAHRDAWLRQWSDIVSR